MVPTKEKPMVVVNAQFHQLMARVKKTQVHVIQFAMVVQEKTRATVKNARIMHTVTVMEYVIVIRIIPLIQIAPSTVAFAIHIVKHVMDLHILTVHSAKMELLLLNLIRL